MSCQYSLMSCMATGSSQGGGCQLARNDHPFSAFHIVVHPIYVPRGGVREDTHHVLTRHRPFTRVSKKEAAPSNSVLHEYLQLLGLSGGALGNDQVQAASLHFP